jgi:signal transduction histidine kinase
MTNLSILILEDREPDFDLVANELRSAGFAFRCERAETIGEYLAQLDAAPDIILADYALSGFNALMALELLQERGLDIPFIVLTGVVDEEQLVECMKRGAADYLLKDRLTRLGPAVHRALQEGDVRRKKRAAEAALMAQTQELTRSNEELKQFAYAASHDLQEPLRMVTFYTQLLAKRYRGKLDSDADEFIGFALEGATRMSELVKHLLYYSRVSTRKPSMTSTDCEEVFQECLANLRLALTESGASVTHDPLPVVNADALQFGQMFQNLIGNAIKFRGEKPPSIHVSAEEEAANWHFSVRDDGIGIEPQYFNQIFVIFQRLHGRTEYPGSGVGLALCKRIMEHHGGRIWVESEAGAGATFHFTIPKEYQHAA